MGLRKKFKVIPWYTMVILWYTTVFLYLTIVSVSALSCNPSSISKNYIVGNQISSEIISCNNENNFSINIFKSGDFFTTIPSSISLSANSNQTFTINFNQIGKGLYNGFLYSSDGYNLQIKMNITDPVIDTGGVIVFPTAKVINIQQQSTKQQNIQIIVPSTYPRNIIIQSVTQNPEIDLLTFEDLNLGSISPGMTLNIPFKIDSTGAQTGTYSTTINILATDSNGQIQLPPVNLQIIVSASLNPTTNSTFTRPSCILSATTINLNQTANLKCTNAMANIDISPQYNEFIQGVSADYSAGVYTYVFQPIKVGSGKLTTLFLYKNSPIFTPDVESFKVIPTTLNLQGNINLDADFYQNGVKCDKENLQIGKTNFLVVDSSSRNIISDFEIYLNGQKYNGTIFDIEANKIYDLRIDSPGYNTVTFNITAKNTQIVLTINPDKSEYLIGDTINFSSNYDNVSYLVNNYIASNPYSISQSGNLTIEAKKENYISANRTIYVRPNIYLVSCTPLKTDWKKGNTILCSLSEKTKWEVLFESKSVASGESDKVEFKIDEYGQYYVTANGKQIDSATISKVSHWYNPFSWDLNYIKSNWVMFGIILLVIGGIGFVMFRNGHNESNLTPYS